MSTKAKLESVVEIVDNNKIGRAKVVGFTEKFVKVWKFKGSAYIKDADGENKVFFVKPENVLVDKKERTPRAKKTAESVEA